MAIRKTTEEFINNAKKVHGDKYDYSLVDYIGALNKIKIICPIHGIFEQAPSNHLSGNKCYMCNTAYKFNKKNLLKNQNKNIMINMIIL